MGTDVGNLSLVLKYMYFKPWNLARLTIYDHGFLEYASAVEPPVRDYPKTLTRIEQ